MLIESAADFVSIQRLFKTLNGELNASGSLGACYAKRHAHSMCSIYMNTWNS
jgi:hypothetical protein